MLDRILAWLEGLNRTVVFLGTLALVVGMLLLGGWFAAAVLGVLALGIAGVLMRTWDQLSLPGRLARLAVLGLLAALAAQAVR